MKKLIIFLLFTTLLYSSDFGATFNGGKAGSIEVYRAGLQKYFDDEIYSNELVVLNGFHEVSFGTFLGHDGDKINVIAYSPVFILKLKSFSSSYIKPYIDAGIGASYITRKKINGKRFSTGFEFEDRVSLGFSVDNIDLYLRYMHYSNGGIKNPNDGIDIALVGINYRF